MGNAKSKADDTTKSKADIIQLAQNKSAGLDVVVQGDDEDVLPWHAVPNVKDVIDDLASNAEAGLTSGGRRTHWERTAGAGRGRGLGRGRM